MTATISFSELFTYGVDDPSERLPLSDLDRSAGHVHGRLEMVIDGLTVPHMGFFGPDDVCFNDWIEELLKLSHALETSSVASYVFDEGEQGQPAFEFRREGQSVAVSIVESLVSRGAADLSFQGVTCLWPELRSAIDGFLAELRETVLAASPRVGKSWWAERMQLRG